MPVAASACDAEAIAPSPVARPRARPLEGRTALVTGAARRLGRATALALASRGAAVVLHYLESEEDAEHARRAAAAEGADAWTLRADLRDAAARARLLAEAEALAGPIDLLVNNASVFPRAQLSSMEPRALRETVEVNAWAPLELTRALARGGREACVVNLLDARPTTPRDRTAYRFSKDLLQAMTTAAALAFAPAVRVNAVAPGPILPPPPHPQDPEAGAAAGTTFGRLVRQLPLQRRGTPEDVAEAVVYLASAPFVTGQVLFVDGGQHLAPPAADAAPEGCD